MAESIKEAKKVAQRLFHQYSDLLSELPPDLQDHLRLLIFLSLHSSLELTKLTLTTGNPHLANQVVDELESLLRSSLPKVTVTVRSAVALDPDDEDKLRQLLEAELGKKIILRQKVEPSFLGGIVLEYLGKVVNLTVDESLTSLKQHLHS